METKKERWALRWHSGRVQHVGFRCTALRLARELGLTGWVRNLPDGRVDMEIQGERAALGRFLLALESRPPIEIRETEKSMILQGRGRSRFPVRIGRGEKRMNLFRKREPEKPRFPAEEFEPVLRCSICTGEQTACMREKATGKLRELELIRDERDLEKFCKDYGVKKEDIRKIY